MNLKYYLKAILPKAIIKILCKFVDIRNKIKNIYLKSYWSEKHSIFYDRQAPVAYIIRIADSKIGLFGIFCQVLSHIKYAVLKGYIPVVDLMHYENQYLEKNQLGKINAWELFFEQPSQIKNGNGKKIISSGFMPEGGLVDPLWLINNPKELLFLRTIVQKSIHLNSTSAEKLKEQRNLLHMDKTIRVLGCLCRGTDYLNRHPKEHPVQPEPDDVIKKCSDVLREQNCKLIFLATEDEKIYSKFKKHFGDLVITNDHAFFHDTGTSLLCDIKQGRDNEKYLRGLEYLVTIYLLSECNCLVAGRTNGSAAALMLSSGYEYVHIYDLGYYE